MSVQSSSNPKISRQVSVSSLRDLSKISYDVFDESPQSLNDDTETASTFEEVPGAWSGGTLDDDEEILSPFEVLSEKARKNFVIAFVFSILTLIGILFLIASLSNGGLPRYGVEQAEKIVVHYDEFDKFTGELKRDGNWKYYRFQSHNEVENITATVQAQQIQNGTYTPPLAVYIKANTVPIEAVDVNGTSILQGTIKPEGDALEQLLKANLIVCGPRTVYVGITLPYWTPATSSFDAVHFELTIYREIPDSVENLCDTERFKAFLFVFILQPVAVWICTSLCFVFISLGLYNRYKLKKISETEFNNDKEYSIQ